MSTEILTFAPTFKPEEMFKAIEAYKAREGEEGYDPALVATMEALYMRPSWPQRVTINLDRRLGPERAARLVGGAS